MLRNKLNRRFYGVVLCLCCLLSSLGNASADRIKALAADEIRISAIVEDDDRDTLMSVKGVIRDQKTIARLASWLKKVSFRPVRLGEGVDWQARTLTFCQVECFKSEKRIGFLGVVGTSACVYQMLVPVRAVYETQTLSARDYRAFNKWLASTNLPRVEAYR